MSRHVWLVAMVVLAVVGSAFLLPSGGILTQPAGAQETSFIMNVGVQDEMKSRNVIRNNYFTGDVWTADAINPTQDGTVQTHPDTQELLPYVMAGTDVNGDGNLGTGEVGQFAPITGEPDNWVAFYDINGLKFHDGTQVTVEDVVFSYFLEGLSPAIGSARFSKDLAGDEGSNYTETHWLWIQPAPAGQWLGAAMTQGQFALKFFQTGANAQFNRDTLQTTIVPAYFWQGTGVRKLNGAIVASSIHSDFGWAINPDPDAPDFDLGYLNGVPAAGYTMNSTVNFQGVTLTAGTHLNTYDLTAASQWDAQDQDVIGIGPFKFVTWAPGQFARLDKNPDYFIPDASIGAVTIQAGLRVPRLDSIVYRLYKNTQAAIFALQGGDVDFNDWYAPAEYVAPLLADPNVGLLTSADAGFYFLSFNFRRLPFGYVDPAQGSNLPLGNDIGKPFRTAVAHAIDKRTIVTSLLQNFGVPGHTVVSPTNTLYYNSSAPRYAFDLTEAASILDAAVSMGVGYGLDPAGDCQTDGTGCRNLPGRGTGLIEMLTPQADYDPVRAAAGTLIAQNLRSIGVNIIAKPTAFGQIVTRTRDLQDFDMWIIGWSLTGYIVPSYMDDFFNSRNTGLTESNEEGYVNDTLDGVLNAAIAATPGSPEAVRLWKYAQGIVAGDLAYDVLYYRTNIFAFRQDRISTSSWRYDIGGDAWFYWSWILLDPAPPGLISVSAIAPSAVASGGTASVTATVRDPDLSRLSGAAVTLSVSSGGGTITPTTGTTDANGQFTATFTAPTLQATDTPVSTFISVQANHATYGASKTTTVVLSTFPPGAKFLSLILDTPFGNVVDEGRTTVLDISAVDENGLAADTTAMVLTPSPTSTGLLSETTFTTDATGRKQVTFNAPQVDQDTPYTVTVDAQRGDVQGTTQVVVTVLDVPAPPPTGIGAEVFLIIGAVVAVGAAGTGYYVVRRRRTTKK